MTTRFRSAKEAFDDVPDMKIEGEMLALAEHIIKTKRDKFDPTKFDDPYEAALAEYSRELSVSVFAGQCRLAELGFRQGGAPGTDFAEFWAASEARTGDPGRIPARHHAQVQVADTASDCATDRLLGLEGPDGGKRLEARRCVGRESQ